jgi:hypothetical protein
MAVTTAPTHPLPTARRLLLLAVAVLVLATGLVAGPGRADALTPGAPRFAGLIGWDHEVLVAWSLPFDGGEAPTSFRVERYKGDAALPEKSVLLGGSTMWMVDKGLDNDTTYRYRIQAYNQDGASGWSAKEAIQAHQYQTHLRPFSDAGDYVSRQYQDLLGRAPSPAELAFGKVAVTNGLSGAFTDNLAHTPARVAERHPVIRLYFAFFDRSPDVAGANYWIAKRKAGMNLNAIASKFAGSSEFLAKYGKLSNQAFVEQVYLNVFDRQPDPAGLAYWTKKLDTHAKTRGEVMVGFSESSEYAGTDGKVGRSTGRVEAADIWMAIMKTVPSTTALDTYYAPHIQHGGNQGVLAMVLMPTVGYPK